MSNSSTCPAGRVNSGPIGITWASFCMNTMGRLNGVSMEGSANLDTFA